MGFQLYGILEKTKQQRLLKSQWLLGVPREGGGNGQVENSGHLGSKTIL